MFLYFDDIDSYSIEVVNRNRRDSQGPAVLSFLWIPACWSYVKLHPPMLVMVDTPGSICYSVSNLASLLFVLAPGPCARGFFY